MKKLFILSAIITISFFSFQNIYGQGLKLGIGGGFSFVQTPAFYTDVKDFTTEYHIGLKGKLDLPLIPFTPVGFIEYHFLRGTENSPGVSADTKQNILSLGVGAEFSMAPGPLGPYLTAELEYNNFGDLETAGEPAISGKSRMGIGFGAGVELNLLLIDVDVSLKYQLLNLLGKPGGEETVGIINLNAAVFF